MIAVVIALVVLFLMAGLALSRSEKALDGAIIAQLRLNAEIRANMWMKSSELAYVFGGEVYPRLRRMVEAGLVERLIEPTAPNSPRRGMDRYWYRWASGKDDAIVTNLKDFEVPSRS